MHIVELNNPLHGAAYRVLFERLEPMNCATPERFAEIKAEFSRMDPWLLQQVPEIAESYRWAIRNITAEIDKRFRAHDLGSQINAAYLTIPKP